MFKKKLCLALIVGFSLFGFPSAFAADAPVVSDPEKLKLIKELLVASRTTRNARVGFDLVFSQQIKGMTGAMADRIDRNPMLTQNQKAEAKADMTAAFERRTKRFNELVNEQLHLDEAIEQTFIPMFDKHFTSDELKEMLTYFKSPVGQKSLDLLPQMSMEAALTLNKQLVPKLREISIQVEEEEQARGKTPATTTTPPAVQNDASTKQTSP